MRDLEANKLFSTSLDSQIASLKAQQLSKVGQDLLLLSQQIADLDSKLKTQENTSSEDSDSSQG